MQSMFGALRLPRSILFGRGQRHVIGSAAAKLGQKALLCTDPRQGSTAEFASIVADLGSHGIEARVFDRTVPDLPISSISDCVSDLKGYVPDVVIGVGGGSSIDMAKLVATLLAHGGQVSSYYGEFNVPGPVIPIIAVPTTAGTGSEVTPVAVVADEERGAKVGIASPHLIPIMAVCDPELTVTCPPSLTATSGADALTHAVESVSTLARPIDAMLTEEHVFVGKNVLSDQFAKLAIANVFKFFERAYADGEDIQAREGMMLAALSAGIAFGTAGTAAAHALQYPIGNLTHTAHGDGVSTLLPYVMQYNRPACVPVFADLAQMIGLPADTPDKMSQAFIEAVASLLAAVNIPRTLRELGLSADKQDYVAENALNSARLVKNNPRPLDLASMQQITRAAFSGDRLALRVQ